MVPLVNFFEFIRKNGITRSCPCGVSEMAWRMVFSSFFHDGSSEWFEILYMGSGTSIPGVYKKVGHSTLFWGFFGNFWVNCILIFFFMRSGPILFLFVVIWSIGDGYLNLCRIFGILKNSFFVKFLIFYPKKKIFFFWLIFHVSEFYVDICCCWWLL